jgi:hypothetical protein
MQQYVAYIPLTIQNMEGYNFSTGEKPKADSESKESDKGKSTSGRVSGVQRLEVQPKQEKPKEGFDRLWLGRTAEQSGQADKKESKEAAVPKPAEPLERISETEKQPVERLIVESFRQQDEADGLRSEQQEDDPAERAGDEAVERFRDKIIVEAMDSDEAEAETLQEIPVLVEAASENNEPAPEIPGESLPPETETGSENDEEAIIDTHNLGEGELLLNRVQKSPEDSENNDEDDDSQQSAAPSAPAASKKAGHASGGGVPPTIPPGGGVPPTGPASPGNGGGPNFNTIYTQQAQQINPNLTPNDPTMISIDAAYYYARRAEGRGLLLGGILGYLIGRRRGRIKTEKKLLPIQKKLEKEVKNLQQDLEKKERTIRLAAAEHVRRQAAEKSQRDEIRQLETSVNAAQTSRGQVEKQRPNTLEARQLHSKNLPPERIGHVLVTAEAVPLIRTAETPKTAGQPPKPERLLTAKQIETMSRAELLALSEKVVIDGASLRQVYETHLVGERGLRRVITEYLRGGDYKSMLRRELVEREIDFERDPILRDKGLPAGSGSGKAALNNLLAGAGVLPNGDDSSLGIIKTNPRQLAADTRHKQRRQRVADVSLVSTIVVLVAVIAIILFTYH